MAHDIKKIIAGAPLSTGGTYIANPALPEAQWPTDTNTALDALLVQYGYVSEDGVERTIDDDTEKVKAWGGDTVRTLQNSHDVTIEFTLLQWASKETQELLRGKANVTEDGTTKLITSLIKSGRLDTVSIAFEMQFDNVRVRSFAPTAEITGVGSEKWVHSEVIAVPLTLEVLPTAAGWKMKDFILPPAA